VDLAAFAGNAKAAHFYTENDNALDKPWHKMKGLLWLNPPYKHIKPWAEKCAIESELGANILFLVPASFSDWFVNLVVAFSDVYFLHGRLCFDGKAPYPKDCMLCHFRRGAPAHEFYVWSWKKDILISR
jgi:site-specific DNA-methyltransferase (adenine-specific)